MNTSQISRSSNRLHALNVDLESAPSICADCTAFDPQWAVLNRGVLVCTECCSVHRSLGRHVSQVRSLRAGVWHRGQLELVCSLYANGANNVWEHGLVVDAVGAKGGHVDKLPKKPNARDPINPVKGDFIRAKYANLAYCWRPAKDDDPHMLSDVNRQLWCCARTGHVTTSLRLLALGADANCADEHGVTAMHVAARENQPLQVELLFIYGGDPACPDKADERPADVAASRGHTALARRLVELQFELTDRMSAYLCGRRPEHFGAEAKAAADRVPFLVPEMAALGAGQGSESSLAGAIARRRLRLIPAEAFEHLAQDLFDEMERRETDAAWLAAMTPQEIFAFSQRYIVPFLPPNASLSATRNQCRQKLAKLTAREFARVLIDVLAEARSRWHKAVYGRNSENSGNNAPENDAADVPEYLRPVECSAGAANQSGAITPEGRSGASQKSSGATKSQDLSDNGVGDYDCVPPTGRSSGKGGSRRAGADNTDNADTLMHGENGPVATYDDLLEVRDQLHETKSKVAQVQHRNDEIVKQLQSLTTAVNRLHEDNVQLRVQHAALLRSLHSPNQPAVNLQRAPSRGDKPSGEADGGGAPAKIMEPHKNYANVLVERSPSLGQGEHPGNVVKVESPKREDLPTTRKVKSVEKLHLVSPTAKKSPLAVSPKKAASTDSQPGAVAAADGAVKPPLDKGKDAGALPYPDNVIVLTEQLTSVIQSLLSDAHRGHRMRFPAYANEMRVIADRMCALIAGSTPQLRRCLDSMSEACVSLVVKCGQAASVDANVDVEDTSMQQAVQSAYSVAKHAKQLLALIQIEVGE